MNAVFVLCVLCVSLAWGGTDARWRGFNLLEMFIYSGRPTSGFQEQDFQFIHEHGFNFVRLPMDYRFWIKDQQWDVIDESKLTPVDQAIALGKKYQVHVQVAFHRIPGYTVAKPAETRDLFTDAEALRVACLHWKTFAKRYKGIPSSELSFNLFNEPGQSDTICSNYVRVATALVEAIRSEDPTRFIVADGLAWGRFPVEGLYKLGIGQATRGYSPMSISHYRASWVGTPTEYPAWPPASLNSPLMGAGKKEANKLYRFQNVPACRWTIAPARVSGRVTVRVDGDGKKLFDFTVEAGQGSGWSDVVYHPEWKIAQATCKSTFAFDIKEPIKDLQIRVEKGDWIGFQQMACEQGSLRVVIPFSSNWGVESPVVAYTAKGFLPAGQAQTGAAYLLEQCVKPWLGAKQNNVFVMVGEAGAYRYTPHAIVIEWLEDNLKNWKEQNWGWALWNLRGAFGVLDSEREDVIYENYQGHKLDRAMLELLKRY